jgi:very-short-patch-repair endonuclease
MPIDNLQARPGSSLEVDGSPNPTALRLVVNAADAFNYAAWQNAVPLLQSVSLDNSAGSRLSALTIEMSGTPAFVRPKRWVVDELSPGEILPLRDIDLEVDPDFLDRLDEAVRGVLTFQVICCGVLQTEVKHLLRVLSRDEWGGMNSMGELLPAFVTPNDPTLASLLKSAALLLGKHGHSTGLDGYQSGDPNRAYMLAASLWSVVAERSLSYANPPPSFEQGGQKTRRVGTVLTDGLATCLDTTLLFASALEAVGLNPVIVMTLGHCVAGVWLVAKSFNRVVERDCTELRKALQAKELVLFETTMVTHTPAGRFIDAVATAARSVSEERESEFVAVVDVARARMSQVLPLPTHVERTDGVSESCRQGPLPLPNPPGFGQVPLLEISVPPQTPWDRIRHWQRKLLDLSLRNRLLNYRASKQTVPIFCPDVSRLEDRLAGGARLRLVSLTDANPLGQRDADLHHKRTQCDLDLEFARQALARDEVACPIDSPELDGRLTALYRKVRNDLAEGGSNTLYLAVGFLRWKECATDTATYRAPLLLIPVKLSRSSASSPFLLSSHEDEVRFNSTLLQFLKENVSCDLPDFDSYLPTDACGVHVPAVLDRMRQVVRDVPGFEVVEEAAIAPFSFAKYLMWKDLADRADQLERNRVVKHLIHDPDKPFKGAASGAIPNPSEVDSRYAPVDIIHPLPADSSQLAAVMAASEGHDFVIVGPPGTGKSQTIANLIAQCLAVGKTVLFVAEKTAALEVVHRRLKEHGLGDCCLELHSNRADRRHFLDQLESSWAKHCDADKSEWESVNGHVRIRRDELNAYADAVHSPDANAWTPYRAMGLCVRDRGLTAPRLDWPASVRHDERAFKLLQDVVAELALSFQRISTRKNLPRVCATDWSMAWEADLMTKCRALKDAAVEFLPALREFRELIGLPATEGATVDEIEGLRRLSRALLLGRDRDVSIAVHEHFASFLRALEELREVRHRFDAAVESASADYDWDAIDRIPVDDLDRRWRDALRPLWPLSWFRRRKVRHLLQTFAKSGNANPVKDLSCIRELQRLRLQLSANPLSVLAAQWKGLDTDLDAMQAHLAVASEIRDAILQLGARLDATCEICVAVLPALRDCSGRHPTVGAARNYLQYVKAFTAGWRGFQQSARAVPATGDSPNIIDAAIEQATLVLECRSTLKQLTAWVSVQNRAVALGLGAFVDALKSGDLPPSEAGSRFELAYARWWLPRIVDERRPLRVFQAVQHQDAIDAFRRLDDLALRAAAPRVRRTALHGLPGVSEVPRKSELGLLRHQLKLRRPSKSIREMIAGMPTAFGRLAPCLLMSPLSIAQYLPVGHAPFDVVVFDEASQIPTWDAIGAIARGRQTVIVGDPRQLPPTNFFCRSDSDEDNDELDDFEKDLESILDEAQASGLPTIQLNWHYRSRHESLISFSNWKYYGNRLVTFPAAESVDRGVCLRFVEGAIYDRGKSRTNRREAEAIVGEAVMRMKRCLKKNPDERRTYGVVTFNRQQQNLIQDLFDQALRTNPDLEWFFSDDRIEPTVVKNLENVQGDERDVMMFSITFGFDAAGKFPIDFGAINREGGERRLNVAVTRARQQLIAFVSFQPEQFRAERSSARGVHDLKAYLEYAKKGPKAIVGEIEAPVGEYESPLEEAVAAALEARGWRVDSQVGVSGFRVDLGVVHPDTPGAYLAGVECDGATYHRSATARDRDKTRQHVLENLGWTILRVWSTDWWYEPDGSIERLHAALVERLAMSRQVASKSSASVELLDCAKKLEVQDIVDPVGCTQIPTERHEEPQPAVTRFPPVVVADVPAQFPLVARQVPPMRRHFYVRSHLPDASGNRARFFDDDYSPLLRQLALSVVAAHAPIRDEALVREVARAHGFARTGSRIATRILDLLSDVTTTEESVGRFLWAEPCVPESVPFRYPAEGAERRAIDEIAMPELIGLIQECPELLVSDDPPLAVAREIGVERLYRAARERLKDALRICKERHPEGSGRN